MKILFEAGSSCVGGAERVIARLGDGLRRLFPSWILDVAVLFQAGGLHQKYLETFDSVRYLGVHAREDRRDALARLLIAGGYDVLHAIDSHAMISEVAAFVAPRVSVLQNVFADCAESRYAPSREWLAGGASNLSVVVTEIEKNLPALPVPGRPPRLRCVVRNGIDIGFWDHAGGDRSIDVLWVGRVEEAKGAEVMLRLVDAAPGLRWHVAANEPQYLWPQVEALCRRNPRVSCSTALPPEAMRDLYRSARVYLHTSLSEGQPATVLEAMACGCLVVARTVGGVPETIDPSCGWLVEPGATDGDFLDAIRAALGALDVGERRVRMRERIHAEHSAEGMVLRYAEIYRAMREGGEG